MRQADQGGFQNKLWLWSTTKTSKKLIEMNVELEQEQDNRNGIEGTEKKAEEEENQL